jgi:hypothetical protein
VSGYRLNHGRYLFESVLTARKWAVIVIAAVIKDPVLSALCTLGLSLIVWSTVALLKPYSDVQNQKFVRIAHSVMVSQSVRCFGCLACLCKFVPDLKLVLPVQLVMLLQASGQHTDSAMKGFCSVWFIFFSVSLMVLLLSTAVSAVFGTLLLLVP